MWCATIDSMMLRATVVDVNPQDPTRVWVTIPQKYGQKPVRVFTRVQATKGDHVYVTNTSATRVPQWVVFGQMSEVGSWHTPEPHTHPIGQVDGLKDWLTQYETWMGDHQAKLDEAQKRIAEGKAEVDAARKDLNQAQTDITEAVRKATLERARLDQAEANLDQMGRNLTAAGGRISANETALKSAQDRLTSAETAVQKTTTDLTAVDTKLTNTSKDLTTLQGTVGDVQSKVVESDRKAAAAQATADQASTAAGNAASKATAAQSTADQAKAAAGTADEAARAASGLASSKGEVIYQASAPTGARAAAQNLWIRTTDNKPHTWNGTAWTPVTDKAATDAAAAAATAQSAASAAQATANQAKADAAAAAQSALDAMTKAGQAQTSADGKNRITRSVSPASQPGTAVGDTHFTMSTMGGGGVVTRQQRWDGSTWQDESLSHQVLASLDLGKATVGELDGAYIKANSILSNRVVVSAGENLIPDPTFLSAAMNTSRTTGTAWRIGTAANGSKVLTTNSGTQSDVPLTGAPDGWMQVDSTAKYQLQMLAGGPDQLSTYLMLLFVDGTSKADGFQFVRGLTGALAPKIVEWDLAALGGPVAVRPMIRRNPTPSGGTNFYTQVGAVSFRRKVGTVLIEDGAVTGDKVEAQTVAAKVGQFVQVKAVNVEVTGELAARVVNAMDTNTRNLVVTESAILQHTTLLGTTVADQLNVRKLLRGRDAIISGTLDVAQLNVTGEMSAKIISTATLQARQGFFTDGLTAQDATLLGTTVAEKLVVTDAFSARVVNAMTAQTKQLVVTEDAILNRATVVQSLVTPELIASKVDARYLRADNIKTGLLEVFGRFRTAPDGQPQIIIQPSQSAWNSKDLAVWFTPDGTTPGGGDAMMYAVTGGMWMNPAGGGGRSESLWTAQQLNLRGQSRAGVRIMDGLTIQSTAGTVGPTINTPNMQFLNIMGQGGVSLTTLSGDARITPWGGVDILANNGNFYAEGDEVRLNGGTGGVRFTDKSGTAGQYSRTTGTAANMNMNLNGVLFRVTSALKYKTQVEEYVPDPGWLDMPVSRWKDKASLREAAELRERIKDRLGPLTAGEQDILDRAELWHVGTIADTAQDVAPHQVMRDINGEVDWYAYDRDGAMLRYFVRQQRDQIRSLEQRVAQLEGTHHG